MCLGVNLPGRVCWRIPQTCWPRRTDASATGAVHEVKSCRRGFSWRRGEIGGRGGGVGGGRRVAPGASLGCAQAPRGSRLDSTAERPHTGEAPWQGGEAPRRGQLPAGARVQGRSPWYAAQGTVNTVTQKRILREHTSGTVWVQPPPLEKTTLGAGTRKDGFVHWHSGQCAR